MIMRKIIRMLIIIYISKPNFSKFFKGIFFNLGKKNISKYSLFLLPFLSHIIVTIIMILIMKYEILIIWNCFVFFFFFVCLGFFFKVYFDCKNLSGRATWLFLSAFLLFPGFG